MSAGRKQRRHIGAGCVEAVVREAAAAPPTYLRPLGAYYEVWKKASMLVVLPKLIEGLAPEVLNAVDRRRRASLTGTCDCGARWRVIRKGRTAQLTMHHQVDCSASDAVLVGLHNKHGWPA